MNNQEAGITKCVVCNSNFALVASQHYVVREGVERGLAVTLVKSTEERLYDAFDCPHCGCQNRVQERMRTLVTAEVEEPTTGEGEGSESEDGQCVAYDDLDDWPFEED